MLCPCGTQQDFTLCCQAIISGKKTANSPEQLMRSRYAAYATKQAKYIYDTYASVSQAEQSIDEISQWAEQTSWLKLKIHNASDYKSAIANNHAAQVEFSAFYLHQGSIWQMREKSNFIIENTLWRYLNGEVFESDALQKPKRNDLCFCTSNKKFKHCCAKLF